MKQIYSDITFLCSYNLMDYSLLVIVETNPKWIDLQLNLKKKTKPSQKITEEAKVAPDEPKLDHELSEVIEFDDQSDFF